MPEKDNNGRWHMTDHASAAENLFREGYNCAQAVLCAFSDVTGMDSKTSALAASSFGGGMGRMREVCGTVSGSMIVLGMLKGYSAPEDAAGKKELYHLVQEFARRFREKNGSIICRELLKGVPVSPGSEPEERTAAYYQKRPCPELVRQAASILEQMLQENGCFGQTEEITSPE